MRSLTVAPLVAVPVHVEPTRLAPDSGGPPLVLAAIARPVRLVPFIEIPFIEIPFIEIPFIEIPFIEIPFIEIPFWLIPFWLISPSSSSPGAVQAPHIRERVTIDLNINNLELRYRLCSRSRRSRGVSIG